MKASKIPTIIAVIILMLAVGAGVFFVQNQQIFRIGASPEAAPQNVRTADISDTSFSVSWTTDKKTVGSLKWGPAADQVITTEPSNEVEGVNTHLIVLNGLAATKTYYFKINSDGTDYDNSGIPWQITTGAALGAAPTSTIVSGGVLTSTGEPAGDAIVYISGVGIGTLSTKTTSSGSFVIPLGNARNSDLTAYADFTTKPTLQINVQAGPSGVATGQFLSDLTTIPAMVLGKTYNFTNQENPNGSEIPNLELNIPETATPSSGFDISTPSASPTTAKTVTLTSVTQNETVTTTKPEFFGSGPAGTKITITVQSEIVSGTVTVAPNGTWTWEPPKDLEAGTHTITISWKDASGVLQKLTKTFVIEAAEGPAFVATPSASPIVQLPTKTATPSATPRITIPSTESGIPKTGTGLPMIIGIGAGLILLLGSIILAI